MLPAALIALRSGLGLGFMFVVAAEFMGASEGLGYLLVDGQQMGKPDQILAAIIAFALLGKARRQPARRSRRGRSCAGRTRPGRGSAMLTLEHLSKTYADGTRALSDITLAVARSRDRRADRRLRLRQDHAACASSPGLDRASAGAIRLDGETIVEPHPAIGMVFQEPRLLPWLSVADNVGFGLDGSPRAERRRGSRMRSKRSASPTMRGAGRASSRAASSSASRSRAPS